MRWLSERSHDLAVALCDSCSGICDEACRHQALRDHALVHQTRLGLRG